jgi:glutathione peroxidase
MANPHASAPHLWDFSVTSIDGERYELSRYRGDVLLIVNTASECGFTPHYAGLQELHAQYAEQGLRVLGFPCNQFGGQEPGENPDIATFCSTKYGVTFPMHAKIDVNGANEEPLFAWLKSKAPGLLGTTAVKWNFTKFLVDRDGQRVTRFAPKDEPVSLRAAIVAALHSSRAS